MVRFTREKFFLAAALVVASAFGPTVAHARDSTTINQPENRELYTSIGDNLLRVTLQESLPNAFGGSDIFGRKRERGFVEIRYQGLNDEGRAVFRRRSVDVLSNETTTSNSRRLFDSPRIEQSGGDVNVAIIDEDGGPANEVLPPNTIEFALDLSRHKIITIEDRVIEILEADPGGVSFIIRRRNDD